MFRAIAAENFLPFGNLRMDIPPVADKPDDLAEVHLLTGVNGTGKTRILSLLAAALGQSESLHRRVKGQETRLSFCFSDVHPVVTDPPSWGNGAEISQQNFNWLTTGGIYNWAPQVPAFAYSGIAYVTDATISVLADLPKPERGVCLAFVRAEGQSGPLLQAIANIKVQAAMELMEESTEGTGLTRATRLARALETAISEITKQRFSFLVASYPKAALSVRWGDTKLPFDVLPDGLRSIIGWLAHAVVMMDVWLEGKGDPLNTEAVFLFDEIETSLHPAWQRKILPAFQRLFPKAQIFCATHSPFLIASLNHGWIHPLSLGPDGRVKVEEPVAASEGDSYVTVLEDIMGIKEWFDPETEELLAKFRNERDAAYRGNAAAGTRARALAEDISRRSLELQYMMGRELHQMDRQLRSAPTPA